MPWELFPYVAIVHSSVHITKPNLMFLDPTQNLHLYVTHSKSEG